jgi:hypothetical protein
VQGRGDVFGEGSCCEGCGGIEGVSIFWGDVLKWVYGQLMCVGYILMRSRCMRFIRWRTCDRLANPALDADYHEWTRTIFVD